MTEKDYSGIATSKIGKNVKIRNNFTQSSEIIKSKEKTREAKKIELPASLIENYKKAGEIAKQVKQYAKEIIKLNMPLHEIAEKIEAKILELGGEIAFPVNLSIDDVAAHYTPTLHDEKLATGLLKVDLGVHINGCICDIAFSLDLTQEKKHAKLIEASEKALEEALEILKKEKARAYINEIGKAIQKTIQGFGFSPVRNLSGHGLAEFEIHSGLTIPNYDNSNIKMIGGGAFAIEPFATSGAGVVYDGPSSNIYHLVKEGQVRDNFSRQVLEYIIEKKKTLPFSQRELEKKFGSKVLIAISNLKRAGIIEEFSQLIEKNHCPISQAETSILIYNDNVDVLCD